MKKTLLMAAMIVATLTASAQARFEPGTFSIQPRLGATGAMFNNTPDMDDIPYSGKIDTEAIGGSFIGVDLEYQFTRRVSFAAGINWSQAGSGWEKFEMTDPDLGAVVKVSDMKVSTGYLNVPLTANWYVAKGLALKTGVQFGFLTSAKAKATLTASYEGQSIKEEVDTSCKEDFNKFDLSIPIGLSYEFKVPFVIDARYNIGLTKVNKESEPGYKDCRNCVFTITLGYKFKL